LGLGAGLFCAKTVKVRINAKSVKVSFLIPVSYRFKNSGRKHYGATKDKGLIHISDRIIPEKIST
jgi:hypothetical protein